VCARHASGGIANRKLLQERGFFEQYLGVRNEKATAAAAAAAAAAADSRIARAQRALVAQGALQRQLQLSCFFYQNAKLGFLH
jgi:hypothetical protein